MLIGKHIFNVSLGLVLKLKSFFVIREIVIFEHNKLFLFFEKKTLFIITL